MGLKCDNCKKAFVNKFSLARHTKSKVCQNKLMRMMCNICGKIFKRRSNLLTHLEEFHAKVKNIYTCNHCGKNFTNKKLLQHHETTHVQNSEFALIENAHNNVCQNYRLIFPESINTTEDALPYFKKEARNLLQFKMNEKKYFKVSCILCINYKKASHNEYDELIEENLLMHFRTKTETILLTTKVNDILFQYCKQLMQQSEDFAARGSGWNLDEIYFCDLYFGDCAPLTGSSSSEYIHKLKYNKKNRQFYIYNSISNDLKKEEKNHQCFYHAIAEYFLHIKKIDSISDFLKTINMNLSLPVNAYDIDKFEHGNQDLDMRINIFYMIEHGEVIPLYASKNINATNIINLLLFKEGDLDYLYDSDDKKIKETLNTNTENTRTKFILSHGHYVFIENMDDFLLKRLRTKNNDAYTRPNHICFNCFLTFTTKIALENHSEWCLKKHPQKYNIPHEDERLMYLKSHKEFKIGYVIFYDFECVSKKTNKKLCKCEEKKKKCMHTSKIMAEQEAIAFSLIVVDRFNNIDQHITYHGEDAGKEFIYTLLELETHYQAIYDNPEKIIMTEKNKKDFNEAKKCYLCLESFLKYADGVDKVRGKKYFNNINFLLIVYFFIDHCHLTGKYLGASCNICNLHRAESKKLVALCHNFSRYDSHIIISNIHKVLEEKPELNIVLSGIPTNTETFKQISINSVSLIDSIAFLPASLDKLVETLKASNHDFKLFDYFSELTVIQKELLFGKFAYPYEWCENYQLLLDTKCLPEEKHFFNNLTNSHVNISDYDHAKKIWKQFNCKNMMEYTLVYMNTDVLLLAEVFMNFRNFIYQEFNIDPCHYLR